MTIDELVDMARRIHDAERVNLGASSTRGQRNAFWERVIGCAHWGHPVYNLRPDPQWHCKDPDGPGGRPQSDDVVVSMPSRSAYDCIPGAGADGYYFEEPMPFTLPADQFVFVPSKPSGHSGTDPIPPVAQPPKPAYPSEPVFWKAFTEAVRKAYSDKGRTFPDPNDADAFRRFARCGFDIGCGMEPQKAADKHIAALRQELGV